MGNIGVKESIIGGMFWKNIDFTALSNTNTLSNDDFCSAGVQMYEFLSLTDALISDYSSVAIDYLVLNKIAFALDDYGIYSETRVFVFENPLDYMPGHHLFEMEDLKSFIHCVSMGEDEYVVQRRNVLEKAITLHSDYTKGLLDVLGL